MAIEHEDCGENCACSRRAWDEAGRLVWKMPTAAFSKRAKTWANGGEPPKPKEKPAPPEPAEEEALQALERLQFTAREAREALRGTTGTVEERVQQALKVSDRQRSF